MAEPSAMSDAGVWWELTAVKGAGMSMMWVASWLSAKGVMVDWAGSHIIE